MLRREKQLTKEFENQLKEEKRNEKLKEKEEREERQKRRMANEYKNSAYQHVCNTSYYCVSLIFGRLMLVS